jgi:hypothetical protein
VTSGKTVRHTALVPPNPTGRGHTCTPDRSQTMTIQHALLTIFLVIAIILLFTWLL